MNYDVINLTLAININVIKNVVVSLQGIWDKNSPLVSLFLSAHQYSTAE